jgi:hypothetical protein
MSSTGKVHLHPKSCTSINCRLSHISPSTPVICVLFFSALPKSLIELYGCLLWLRGTGLFSASLGLC